MKKARAEDGAMAAEYDFTHARKNPYAERANRPSNLVILDPELHAVFPDSEAVNNALRLIVQASAKAVSASSGRQQRVKKAS